MILGIFINIVVYYQYMSQDRKAILEIDKMEGTMFPPGERIRFENPFTNPPITFENKTYNLKGIFSNAGIELDINSNEAQIPFFGDGLFSEADLYSLMSNYSGRSETSSHDMYAYLVIVNGIVSDRDQNGNVVPLPTVLGAMWDIEGRKGTAVFYKNELIRNEPIAFLRTSAHEIGHQFNLHHRDGSVSINGSQKKFSIMNQTDIIVNYGGWPDGISLEFGPLESKHLSHHNIDFVSPGRSPFNGKCEDEHVNWHDEAPFRLGVNDRDLTPFDASSLINLDLQIRMGKSEYLPGQPAIAYIKLTNSGNEPLSLVEDLSPEYNIVKFFIKKDDKEVRFMPHVFYEFVPEKKLLKPNESVLGRAKIFYGSNGYTFPEPGVYQVRAEYHGLEYGVGKIINSNVIDVVILNPKDKEEEEQALLLKGKEQALFFLLEGGDHLKEGIEKLTLLAEKYPQSRSGAYANAVLGLHWTRQFKDFKNNKVREPNYDKAIEYLQNASNKVDGYWANATFINLADIYKKTKDTNSMKIILDKYINKFEKVEKNFNGVSNAKRLLQENESKEG
jgi:hypothetical protein